MLVAGQINAQSPLCESYPTTFCCEYVSSVTINGVTRNGAPDGTGFTSGPGYFDYTGSILTSLVAGNTYPVSVTVKTNSSYQEFVKIWFDFNGNGVLSDAGELVFDQVNTFNGTLEYTGNVTVPSTAFNGDVYIRVVMVYANSPALCGTYSYGTTLDFKATISGGLTSRNMGVTTTSSGGYGGNVVSNPSGINTGSSLNSANFPNGSDITLTATPSAGGGFIGWSGDVTGNSNPLVVTLNSDMNIVASFGPPYFVPTLTTTAASSVTTTTASSGGNISSDGNKTVTERGICWNTSSNPTTDNSKTSDGSGTGSFTSSITGLTSGTLYYVRAYAINSIGTGYGNQLSFATLPSDPTSVTASSSSIYVGSSSELTVNGVDGTVYWYTGSCGETQVGTGNPLIVSPTTTTTYYAKNNKNSVFSAGCVSVTITVNKYDQTLTFNPIPGKTYGDSDFTPASASSSLTLAYSSSNTSVATIVANKVHIIGVGTSDITASQPGNATYNAAANVTQTLTVSKASLTATAQDKNKNYGASNPSLTIAYSGFVNEENELVIDSKPIASCPATALSAVGSYSIDLSAGTDNNYEITNIKGTLTIDKSTLTVTADAKTKVYGEANPSLTFQYSGWLNGDDSEDLATKPSASTLVSVTSPVDIYSGAITVADGMDENYSFSYVPADLTVTKATLTVTADAKTKVYGEANPDLTFQYSGWLNGDDSEDLATEPSASTLVSVTSPVDVYSGAITVADGMDENYSFSYVPADLTVTKATLTVTADAKTKVYGEANPPLTFQYSGWLNGDDSEDLATKPSASTLVSVTSPVDIYSGAITVADGMDENYSFSYVPADLTVTKATLTVTADAKTKVYGEANPDLTFQYSGWLNGDDSEDLATKPSASTLVSVTSPVDIYSGAITVADGMDENYSFSYVPADLTVTKATLTVTADAKTKVYGEANPPLTFQYSGWLNGDDSEDLATKPSASTLVSVTSPVDIYSGAITVADGMDENYSFSYVPADLTVTKATLTVTADAKTKVYGEANPDLTFQYSGWLNGDDSEDLATKPSASTLVSVTSPVDVYSGAITVADGMDENYSFSYVPADLTVTKATLTVTADAKTKVYGEANPDLTFQYSGWLNGDDSEDLATEPSASTLVSVTSPVDVYSGAITVADGMDENYSFSYVPADLTVTKATLTVTADAKTKVYGEANPPLTFQYSGWLNGDDSEDLATKPSASTLVSVTSPVDVYSGAITVADGMDENYSFSYVPADLTVTKATLTVTADAKTKVYGEANPDLTFQYSGWLNGDDSEDLATKPSASTLVSVTSPVDVYSGAITVADGMDENYSFSYVPADLTVTKATLTVTADAKTKVYGEANPSLTFQYSGWLNGDDSEDLATKPSASTLVSVTSPVDIYSGAITVADGMDENYSFSYVPADLTVTKATLTVTADAKTKVYGEANPDLTFQYSGWLNGDDSEDLATKPSASTLVSVTSPVDVYSGAITVADGMDENYSFSYVPADLTVTKATLTVTADAKTKVYGEANPDLTFQYSGWLNGDDSEDLATKPSASTLVSVTSPVDVYSGAITVADGMDENYSFSYVPADLTVTKATLTVTADAKTKVYGEANPPLTFQYSGWLNGDDSEDLATKPSASTLVSVTSPVDIYSGAITVADGMDENYSFSYVPADLTVTKATLTVTADAKTKVYGEANPDLTFQYSGWLNGDDSEDLATKPSASTLVSVTSPVDIYSGAITVADGMDENYSFSYVPADLTVTKATLTVTADAKTKVYGEANPDLTFQYSGWLNGDDSEDLATEPSASTLVSVTSPVDVYSGAITVADGMDENYSFSYVPADLTVTKATLTVTADAKTKVYGEANPPLTYTFSGFLNGDTESDIDTKPIILTTADENSNVDGYPIVLTGGFDNNYILSRFDSEIIVVKASLTATTDNKTKIYSEENPLLTITYSGFRNNDNETSLDISPIASTSATTLSDAGSYPITLSSADDNNYQITRNDGTLSIGKAILHVTSENKTRIYGETNPLLTVSYSGFVNGDSEDVLNTKPTATTTALQSSNAGAYAITATGGIDNNYEFVYTDGSLEVTKSNLTITAVDKSRKYGEMNPELSYSYEGFKNNDEESVLDELPSISTEALITTPVGLIPVTLIGGKDNNYYFTLKDGKMTITKTKLIITADNKSKVYGEENPSFTIAWNGFVNGEDYTALLQTPEVSSVTDDNSVAGVYPILISGAISDNYDIEYIDGELTVTKAPLNVTAVDASKKYLDPLPELTVTYSGFVNNDSQSMLDFEASSSTSATSNSDAGTYEIIASGGSDDNYSYVYNKGILTVNKADQEISFETIPDGLRKTEYYEMDAEATSGLPVSFTSSESLIASISGNILSVEKEGTVQIVAHQEGNNNWNSAPDVIRTVKTLPTFDNIRSLFTPNNDGMNDVWYITDIEQYGEISVQIYNRFGKLLYESADYKNNWNGTYNGTPLPSASYYYIIKSSEKGLIKGVVNLIR